MGHKGSSQPEFSGVQFDKSGLDEWAQTQQGQGYANSAAFNALKNGQLMTHFKNGGMHIQGNGVSIYDDYSGMVNDYNSWMQAQAASKKSRSDYLNLAKDMQGRDSTILTGPGVTKTLLG